MKIKIDASLKKDTDKIKDKKLLRKLASVIERIEKTQELSQIANCKKLNETKNAFRVRIGEYRLAFYFKDNTVIFVRFLHRKDIYRKFP